MRPIERVGVVIKPHAPGIEIVLAELDEILKKHGIACLLEKSAAEILGRPDGLSREEIPGRVDLVVVLGGDGTLLSIAHIAARLGTPVLGVNMGKLGFLSETPRCEMAEALKELLPANEGLGSPRMMLEASRGADRWRCLNDVVINKGALARMLELTIRIDGREIAAVRADGLIVSTPTGSTAYTLAAGGPIIQPSMPAIILTPICPHSLTFRPMVISSRARIQVGLRDSEEAFLTVDGQRGKPLSGGDTVNIARASCELKLIRSPRRTYFDVLKEKLSWGG